MATTEAFREQHYIEALSVRDHRLIENIYRKYAGRVRSFVEKYGGTAGDAASVFQKTITVIYQQARYKHLKPDCAFGLLFLLLCKRSWINEGSSHMNTAMKKLNENLLRREERNVVGAVMLVERNQRHADICAIAFEDMDERCREILTASLGGGSVRDLSDRLGITDDYLRKKKSDCLAAALKVIGFKTTLTKYTPGDISQYVEGVLVDKEKGYFENVLATDPALRKGVDEYLDFRSTLKMVIEKDDDQKQFEIELNHLNEHFFARNRISISFRKLILRTLLLATAAIIILLWYLSHKSS